MFSKNRIINRNVHSKLPIIIFQINSISLIESEEFGETPNKQSTRFARSGRCTCFFPFF